MNKLLLFISILRDREAAKNECYMIYIRVRNIHTHTHKTNKHTYINYYFATILYFLQITLLLLGKSTVLMLVFC